MTSGKEAGFILLDVLVGVVVATVGFATILGGMSVAVSQAAKQEARVESMIEQRSVDAKNHQVVFQKD